jgi:L-threonylcarbamoyladenylate synthase
MASIESLSSPIPPELIAAVRRVIQSGGIVAVPTETYYGLGVNPFDPPALERLASLKGRPDGKPILVLIGHRAQLSFLVPEIPPLAAVLMDLFWPGPLTILFPALPTLPPHLTGGTGTVGVRLTSCEPLACVLQAVGPLTGTSANRAAGPPACTGGEVRHTFGQDIELILDGGRTPGGLPSTIVDGRQALRVIREGAITRQTIADMLQTRGIALS